MARTARLAIFALLIIFSASQSWAGLTLTPGFSLRQEYDDNIYLDSDDEEDDFITTVTPSLLLKWEGPRLDLSLDARINFEKYYDHTDEDRVGPGESDQASTFNALATLYPETLFLEVSDTYQRVPVDEGERGGKGNNVVNLTDSNRLTVNPYLQFEPVSDLQLKLGYAYENLWYGEEEGSADDDDDAGDDAESHTFSLGLTKSLSAKTTLTLNGSHLQYRPKNPSDVYMIGDDGTYEYDRDNVRAGLIYQLSERLTLNGGYGHSWLDYDVREDTDSSVWDAAADFVFSDTLKAGISYVDDYQVTVEDGPTERERYSAYIDYGERIKLKASVFVSNEQYVELNREDDAVGADLSGTFPFSDRSGLDWHLSYENYDQSGFEAEEYDRYGGGVTFYYDISLGRYSLGYTYTCNDSDLENKDYTNNIAFIAANFTF